MKFRYTLLFFCSTTVFAQTSLDPVVVTARRVAVSADDALADVMVIDRQMIERSQAQDAAALIQKYAGIDVVRDGGAGQRVALFTRGTESNHTLVMLDGMNIAPASIGNPGLQHIDPAIIERIEIVKGPRSALYGSEAMGGVINIITRKAGERAQAEASFGIGAHDTQRAHLGVGSGDWGGVKIGATIAANRSDGIPPRQDSKSPGHYRNNVYRGHVDYTHRRHQFGAHAFYDEGSSGYDIFGSPASQDHVIGGTGVNWAYDINDAWTHVLEISHLEDQLWQKASPDLALTRRNAVRLEHHLDWRDANTLLFGAVHSDDDVNAVSYGTTVRTNRYARAVYAQNMWDNGVQSVVAGMRYAQHEDMGGVTTGELSSGLFQPSIGRVYWSVATAFRVPDFTDRFGCSGNPDLEPERARTFEIGWHRTFAKTAASKVTIYQTNIRDLITYVYLGDTGTPSDYCDDARMENVEQARIQGVEWRYDHTLDRLALGFSGTIQNAVDAATDTPLSRRARERAALNISYEVAPAWGIALDANAVGKRDDSPFNDVILGGYVVWEASVAYRWAQGRSLSVKLENLFDKEYEQASGYRTPGLGVFATLSVATP